MSGSRRAAGVWASQGIWAHRPLGSTVTSIPAARAPAVRRSATLLLVLAAALAGCAKTPTSGPPREEPESAEPSARLVRSFDHDFVRGDATIPLPVETRAVATVEMWFEGVYTANDAGSIRLVDPQGKAVLVSEIPPDVAGGSVGGRSYVVTQDVTFEPGAWSVVFEGSGPHSGKLRAR